MQKILQRPICHMTFQQANSIYDEIRQLQMFSPAQHPSLIQRQQQMSPIYQNSFQQQGNIHGLHNNSHSQQIGFPQQPQQGMRMNRLNSLPQNPQNLSLQQQSQVPISIPNFHSPPTPQHHHNISSQQNGNRTVSKDSIIRKYDDFFEQKQNLEQLKQENSRLYYEKLALQASVQRLKEENVKKDNQILRLKEFLEHNNSNNVNGNGNKSPQLQMPVPKPLHGFQSQVINQATSPQVHFRSNYEQKRPF